MPDAGTSASGRVRVRNRKAGRFPDNHAKSLDEPRGEPQPSIPEKKPSPEQ
jgi:hypothetical protein